MCGIAGIWSKEQKPIGEDLIRKMLEAMWHRGPDADGVWAASGLTLGNKRLKILDLSDAANQPFTDGKDALVFNGRIFNFRSLREELSPRFHFKTNCDTEVLLRALQVWDEKVFEKIDGQFAFAFYRAADRTLLLARDHAGICPLYIMETEGQLCFSSEIKPLLKVQKTALDGAGVVDYFTYRYNIQNGRTLFKGIRRFPPAHFLKIHLDSRRSEEKRYWRMRFSETTRSPDEARSEFSRIMDEEIAAQRRADVPVGMYLSGGIDSGALLSGFSRASSEINSFTLSFSSKDNDFKRVQELSRHLDFRKNLITFSQDDLDVVGDVVDALEEPFGDLIICPNYSLAKRASRQVKVVLSGEGGDESFCGYDHQKAFFRLLDISRNRPALACVRMALNVLPPALIGKLQSYPGQFSADELGRIRKVAGNIHDPAGAYLDLVSLFGEAELKTLFSDQFKRQHAVVPDTSTIREIFAGEKDPWRAVMRSEIEQLTLIVNLIKQDRFAMHFSMEGCVPFVSRPILEFAASLPYSVHNAKVNKELLLNYSGQQIIKKKPFSLFSTQEYLQKLIELMDSYVTSAKVEESGVLSWEAVRQLRARLPQGNILVVKRAMAVLIFMVWWEKFRRYLN